VEKIDHYCSQIEGDFQTTIEIDRLVDNKPVALNRTIQKKMRDISLGLSFRTVNMISGAGHDAMNMAERWATGLVFIPCRDGISHDPKEYTSEQNLVNGTELLATYLQSEANCSGIRYESFAWRGKNEGICKPIFERSSDLF